MKRYILALLLLLTGVIGADAQTLVSGTVTDGDSQTWNNGTFKFTTTALAQAPVTGSLSAAGAFTNVSIPHTAATGLVGDTWVLTVCPQFNTPCFSTAPTVIFGASQTLNVAPAAIRFSAATPYQIQPAAYLDVEVTNVYTGFEYWNVTSGIYRVCSVVTGANTCTWVNDPSVGTPSNCNVNSASPAACGSASSGVVVVPTTTTTYTVNTTAVTANSRIQVWPITDNSGVSGAPTCNAPPTPFIGYPSARSAGTSFTFTLPSTTGTSCWNYLIIN